MTAIHKYEKDNGLPHNAINKVISARGHDGAFAKLERGELSLAEFYPMVCTRNSRHAMVSPTANSYDYPVEGRSPHHARCSCNCL